MRCLIRILILLASLSPAMAWAACKGTWVPLYAVTPEQAASGVAVIGDTVALRTPVGKTAAMWISMPPKDRLDLCATVTIRANEKPSQSGGGIIFWSNDDLSDYFLFQIDGNGNATVAHWQGDHWSDTSKWRPTRLLKKGLNVANQLRLTTADDTARAYINGKLFETTTRMAGSGNLRLALRAHGGDGISVFDFSGITTTSVDEPAPSGKDDPDAPFTMVKPAATPEPSSTSTAPVPAVSKLDPEGQRLYELLLATPPSDLNLAAADTEFIEASGNNPAPVYHGLAEVNYRLKPPADGTQNLISFYIYEDEAGARRYLESNGWAAPFRMDVPDGKNWHDVYDELEALQPKAELLFGYEESKRRGWVRWAYRQGRVVIASSTDQTWPQSKEVEPIDRISENTKERGVMLLTIGKLHLDRTMGVSATSETKTPTTDASASLDAAGQRLYDQLLSIWPDPDKLRELGTEFVRLNSNFSPKKAHGQAEIVYELKPPAEGAETSISFFVYPSANAAARYLAAEDWDSSYLSDLPGAKYTKGTLDPFGSFAQPIGFVDGVTADGQRAWIQSFYQAGRVVIVALAGEKIASGSPPRKVSDEIINLNAKLLQIGKLQLETVADATDNASSTPDPAQRTGVAPTGQ